MYSFFSALPWNTCYWLALCCSQVLYKHSSVNSLDRGCLSKPGRTDPLFYTLTSRLSCKSSSISTKIRKNIRSRCLFHMFSNGIWFSLPSLNMCTVCAQGVQQFFHSDLLIGHIWASCDSTANNWVKHSLKISNFFYLLQIPEFI